MKLRTVALIFMSAALWRPVFAVQVFGIELGKSLELPECQFKLTGGKYKVYEVMPTTTCFEEPTNINGYGIPVRRVIFSQKEAPLIVKNWNIIVIEIDGKTEGIHFFTNGLVSQPIVINQLSEKFGKATTSLSRKVATSTSETLESLDAKWDLPGLKVTYWGTSGRIDRGEVYIDSPAASALRASWQAIDASKERKL